jgi:uncharacterized iron-regulated protein
VPRPAQLALADSFRPGSPGPPHIIRSAGRAEITADELLRDLATVQVVFIGELHDHSGHHQAQLSIIRKLHASPQPLAVGLEMFRKDSQAALDHWLVGGYSLDSFLKVYQDNWSMWDKYREIFEFAKRQKVRLVGLNIPRAITAKVASQGFAALPESERQALGDVRCKVTPEYGDFIRRAMGVHGNHGQQYLFFCEAQMLWDTMMARHLVEFLKDNPNSRVVVLAGSGHAWKFGIPRQLLKQMEVTYRVVLPEIDGRLTRTNIDPEVADYLWLDEGPDGWAL